MIVTKEELDKEKARLKQETEHDCKYCKIERSLGFYYCEYHKAVIKYLKEHAKVVEYNMKVRVVDPRWSEKIGEIVRLDGKHWAYVRFSDVEEPVQFNTLEFSIVGV